MCKFVKIVKDWIFSKSILSIESVAQGHALDPHDFRVQHCPCVCLEFGPPIYQSTLGFLAEISFTPLLYHPGGCLGCPEKGTRSRNKNLFVRSAVFQPKWNAVQKTYKNHQNPVKSYCFFGYFQSLFNFGWKTAAQTN